MQPWSYNHKYLFIGLDIEVNDGLTGLQGRGMSSAEAALILARLWPPTRKL